MAKTRHVAGIVSPDWVDRSRFHVHTDGQGNDDEKTIHAIGGRSPPTSPIRLHAETDESHRQQRSEAHSNVMHRRRRASVGSAISMDEAETDRRSRVNAVLNDNEETELELGWREHSNVSASLNQPPTVAPKSASTPASTTVPVVGASSGIDV